jgi:hypothetical protein
MKTHRGIDRRRFLEGVGGAAVAFGAFRPERLFASQGEADSEENEVSGAGRARKRRSLELRREAAVEEFRVPIPEHPTNGDEQRYPNRIGSFSKGLLHDAIGEVNPDAYQSLLDALSSEDPADFERIAMGAPVDQRNKLVDPQAGLAFDLQGTDSHQLALRPAPAFSSPEEAAEMVELYWMALARDVHFSDYGRSSISRAAASELSSLPEFTGPRDSSGTVTGRTLFRGPTPGDLAGPYLSQFLWLPAQLGSETIDSRQRTIVPGLDYMTEFGNWLAVQNGFLQGPNQFDETPRHIRNGRDLSAFVHIDALFQAYLLAALVLSQLKAPLNPGNPYLSSSTQTGFGTFGPPFLLTILVEGCTRGLKAVWYQKWFVHRRLRPEAFGGRVHNVRVHAADYPIHPDVLDSRAAYEVGQRYGTYLLPMAFPEGSPVHPSYGAGHATVAGCCVTMLKAMFDGSVKIADLLRDGDTQYRVPVVSSSDGLSLIPYDGDDIDRMTVEGELNKVASNIGMGRNHAGVHWRSDEVQSFSLGEQIAMSILRDQKHCYNEDFGGFTFTKFDGKTITV